MNALQTIKVAHSRAGAVRHLRSMMHVLERHPCAETAMLVLAAEMIVHAHDALFREDAAYAEYLVRRVEAIEQKLIAGRDAYPKYLLYSARAQEAAPWN